MDSYIYIYLKYVIIVLSDVLIVAFLGKTSVYIIFFFNSFSHASYLSLMWLGLMYRNIIFIILVKISTLQSLLAEKNLSRIKKCKYYFTPE